MSMTALPQDPQILAQLPVAPPPPGIQSNFDDPTSRGQSLIINNAVWLALSLIAVLIRFYSKAFVAQQNFGWDDGACVLATLGSIVHTAITIHAVKLGYGRHLWDIRLISFSVDTAVQLNVVDIVYGITIYLVKVTLLLFYHRLFKVSRPTRYSIYFGFVFCTLLTIPYVTVSIYRAATCPQSLPQTPRFCGATSIRVTNLAFGALNIFTDFYILIIPIARVRKLQVSRKRRQALLIPFVLGFIACSMSVARYAVIITLQDSKDTLYNAATTSQFSCIEMKLAIICSCIIFIPSFYKSSKDDLIKTFDFILSKAGSSRSQLRLTNSSERTSSKPSVWQSESNEQTKLRPSTQGGQRDDLEMYSVSVLPAKTLREAHGA